MWSFFNCVSITGRFLMLRDSRCLLFLIFVCLVMFGGAPGQTSKQVAKGPSTKSETPKKGETAKQRPTTNTAQTKSNAPDLTKEPTLYVVGYAHLDTQWRWEFPQTISEYLLKTMRVNFDFIDKYPHYVFNWTGANRYRLMKEYFPSDYQRMK